MPKSHCEIQSLEDAIAQKNQNIQALVQKLEALSQINQKQRAHLSALEMQEARLAALLERSNIEKSTTQQNHDGK